MAKKTKKSHDANSARLSVDELRRIFENAGLRLTHQRIMVYNAVVDSKEHPSAETIYEQLKKDIPTISLDTVYRTLSTLDRLGLIKRLQLFDYIRFEPDLSRHHHFICKKCKKIIDFHWPEIDGVSIPETLKSVGEVQDQMVEVRGICKECLAQEGGEK
ncbi:MAG: transcriptional repressor [Thermodesulfobacteria bacterium]|nr:transcriptional repressor [Thermodesulfobacteriota bacterium]